MESLRNFFLISFFSIELDINLKFNDPAFSSSFHVRDANAIPDIVVGDYINTMKTTVDLNFDLKQTVKQLGCTWIEVKRRYQSKSISLIIC